MNKILAVMRREFLTRVRTKWFVLGTLFGPVLMFGLVAIPVAFADRGGSRTVFVLDATTSGFGERLTELLDQFESIDASQVAVDVADLERRAGELAQQVGVPEGSGATLDGFLVITDAAVDDGRAEYRGRNVASMSDMQQVSAALRNAVFAERLRREGVEPGVVARARIPVELTTRKVRDGAVTEESGEASFILAYAMWLLLYIAILLYGTQVMGSVVEEKTTRVVEVLTSSLRPFQLLAGKVVGVGAVGLLQLGIWAGFGKLMIDRRGDLVRLLAGPEQAAALAGISFPEVPLATVAVFLSYFLLGYFLYAAMFAGVGAMVSSEAEGRQAQTPVVMLLVIPAMMVIGVLNNPDGGLAIALSVIPFTSPIGMPVRWAAAPVPAAELAASIGALAVAVVLVTWLAGRIYRVGILMYGKRPGLRELLRWVRG